MQDFSPYKRTQNKQGGCYSSVDLSAPTVQRPWVRVPNRILSHNSMYMVSIETNVKNDNIHKEAGI